MAKKQPQYDAYSNKNIDLDNIAKKIFDSIYDVANYIDECKKCHSKNIELIDPNTKLHKCHDCGFSFSPKVNSLYAKLRLNEEKLYEFIKGMINDATIEDLSRKLMLSSDSVINKWTLLYNEVNWDQFNLTVREKPSRNIYANFEVIIG